MNKFALISFTERGKALREKVAAALGGEIEFFDKNTRDVKTWVGEKFSARVPIVFIGAAGIAVRLIAPLVASKDKDPAVIVIDEAGRYVVPLLSGHIGGANALAARLAASLGARAVITTATDINGVFAADAWAAENGCAIGDISNIKHVSSALLNGAPVGFHSDFPVNGGLPRGLITGAADIGVCVSLDDKKRPFKTTLNVIPRIITVGAGCRKAADSRAFEEFIRDGLARNGVSLTAVEALASIDIKSGEDCMIKFAQKNNIEFVTYSAEELQAVEGEFASSGFVEKTAGVGNVCERAAAKRGGRLIIRKTARGGMTLAAAARDWECAF